MNARWVFKVVIVVIDPADFSGRSGDHAINQRPRRLHCFKVTRNFLQHSSIDNAGILWLKRLELRISDFWSMQADLTEPIYPAEPNQSASTRTNACRPPAEVRWSW